MEEKRELTDSLEDRVIVAQLLRGERPSDMKYDEFKIKRRAIKAYLKNRLKGKLAYISKELTTDIDPATGIKKEMIKVYPPYKRTEAKKIGRVKK